MADDKINNNGFDIRYQADTLREMTDQFEIDNKTLEKGESGNASKKPVEQKVPQSVISGQEQAAYNTLDYHHGDILLDTYRVESDSIKGGMGAVWHVHHTGWNVDLAMKRPRPEAFRNEGQKEDFIDECKHWMDLGLHPNVVSCYYVREIEGIPTIFSEWMDNGCLEDHIIDGMLYDGTPEEVQERLLDIAIQSARGLHYAHENNLIHRDVKPNNMLLNKEWTVKVSDFGLSKARTMLTFLDGTVTELEMNENATVVSPSSGQTPAYCSPEQAAAQLLTKRTDIYSWAVSVLEMYLGYKPWAHGRELTGPLVGIECREYFEKCSEKRPIPKALQELLAKCLEQDPDDRPVDFGVVEAELHKIYKNETGTDYLRPNPKVAADTADSLNNRALGYIDIGESEKAEALWEKAIQADMYNLHTIYNQGLWQWRKGQITDEELLRRLLHAKSDKKEEDFRRMIANIHLERGDATTALSFLSEDDDEKLRDIASHIIDLQAHLEGNLSHCPISDCNIIASKLIPQSGKIISQVLTRNDQMRIVLWDPKSEEESCILDEWRYKHTPPPQKLKFTLDITGNYAAALIGCFGELCKISVWDLREGKKHCSYSVPAKKDFSYHHIISSNRRYISSDGRWLAVTMDTELNDYYHIRPVGGRWMVESKQTGYKNQYMVNIDALYYISENGSVMQGKKIYKKGLFNTTICLVELYSNNIPRIFCTKCDPNYSTGFSLDNKLLIKSNSNKDTIVVDPDSLQSEKRCLSEKEMICVGDFSFIPVQSHLNMEPKLNYRLYASVLYPNGNILVRRFGRDSHISMTDINIENPSKYQLIHVPTRRCMTTLYPGATTNSMPSYLEGNSVWESLEKDSVWESLVKSSVIPVFPQWIYHAPMLLSFTVSIGSTRMAFEMEKEYEGLIQAGEQHFANGCLKEALSCVEHAWSLREPDERLFELNRHMGQACVAVGIRSLRKVGTFPFLIKNKKDTPLFSQDGTSFVTRNDKGWQKFDAMTLLPLSAETDIDSFGFNMQDIDRSSTLSPDGRFLYVENYDVFKTGIGIIDLVAGQKIGRFLRDVKDYSYMAPLLSPSGDILYCNNSDTCFAFSTSMINSISGGDVEIPYEKAKWSFKIPQKTQKFLSSDGERMYCTGLRDSIWAYDIRNDPQILFVRRYEENSKTYMYQNKRIYGIPRPVTCALSPDDKQLCILLEDGQIELLDARNGELLYTFPVCGLWEQLQKYSDISHKFSGGRLLVHTLYYYVKAWEDELKKYSLLFSPDGNLLLLFVEESIVIYDIRSRVIRGVYAMDEWAGNGVFAPDGRLFTTHGIIYEVDYIYRSPNDFPELESI